MSRKSLALFVGSWALGCAASPSPAATSPSSSAQPVVAPPAPTPTSVTRAAPGGDSADPHGAALQRLLQEPWGARSDRDQQLVVALPDAENWKRVRYWGVEHFLGFRYGSDHHAMVIVFVQEAPEEQPSSEQCLRRFEAWGRPQIQPFQVDFDPFKPHHDKFRGKSLIALSVDGQLNWGFGRPQFSAAWAAYSLYPHTCLVSAVGVPWRGNEALAAQVRDRFVTEGFAKLEPVSQVRPERKSN